MVDENTRNGKDQPEDDEQFGWNFHKGPLIAAAILTAIFYAIVFVLAWI